MSKNNNRDIALIDVDKCGLHKRTPYVITDVSRTQFSVAKHYGGAIFNGDRYTYIPITDELIRDDVLKWKSKQERALKSKPQSPNLP